MKEVKIVTEERFPIYEEASLEDYPHAITIQLTDEQYEAFTKVHEDYWVMQKIIAGKYRNG